MTTNYSKLLTSTAVIAAFVLAVSLFGDGKAVADPSDAGWREMNEEIEAWLKEQSEPDATEAADDREQALRQEVKTVAPGQLVFINEASQAELEALPGIGKTKAEAIVAYREQHGPFVRLEDVMNVKGIGPKIFEKIRPFLALESINSEK